MITHSENKEWKEKVQDEDFKHANKSYFVLHTQIFCERVIH